MIKKIFKYIENLWLGSDGKPSLRASLAIAFSIDFIRNLSYAIYKWDAGRSLEGLSMVMGIEAGLIVGLLGLTAWSNVSNRKTDAEAGISTITVEKAETVTSGTKVDTVNATNVDTVNTQTANINSVSTSTTLLD